MEWYDSLIKPAWTPPGTVIGTIWTIIYPLIIIVFCYVGYRVWKRSIPASVLIPIAINVAANVAFTPIQFGMRNLGLAAADILVVLVTIVWCMLVFWPYSRPATFALVPYLVWVSIATVLQFSITLANR